MHKLIGCKKSSFGFSGLIKTVDLPDDKSLDVSPADIESIFILFKTIRENRDIFFTACLPVRKRDMVKARVYSIVAIELMQTVAAIPVAIIRRRKEITCSFSKKNGESGLCFLKFIEQVISLQALSGMLNQHGNTLGMDANMAFFGFVLIMYAIFNVVFLPMFYIKKQQKTLKR